MHWRRLGRRWRRCWDCRPLEIVFTGGGTESDNLAVKGAALAGGKRRGVVTSAVEHEAVLSSVRFLKKWGCPVTRVGVDRDGLVDPSEVAEAVTPHTAVVSVMAANNETGTRQPVQKIAEAVRDRTGSKALIHTDAVQAFVSEELGVDELGVDLLSLAAHKFGGPTGVGVLYVRDGVALEPVVHGGGQELGRRSGTHHVLGAVGMAVAMELAAADRARFHQDVSEARRRFETGPFGEGSRLGDHLSPRPDNPAFSSPVSGSGQPDPAGPPRPAGTGGFGRIVLSVGCGPSVPCALGHGDL